MTGKIQRAVEAIRKCGRLLRPSGHVATALTGALLTLMPGVAAPGVQQPSQTPAPDTDGRSRLTALVRQATDALRSADDAGATRADVLHALETLAARLAALSEPPAAGPMFLPAPLRADLARAASSLRKVLGARDAYASRTLLAEARAEHGVDGASLTALLARAEAALEGDAGLGLTFQGSFSETRAMKDPVTGGHASAMGPAPAPLPASGDAAGPGASPATFAERPPLPTRTWAGGPTKDHILESAGNGVALFDFDADGWLDVYLVTAARISPARERLPQRNALYRNLGGWRFEDVSDLAGVDAAAWGSGACVGDVDGDGRLDLYVTNWGPNLLYRNRGDGTFEEVAGAAGVAAGGWSTGCAFLDADADGDLDLYVARYVSTTWDDVVRARRTLTWRNGPRIMVGPAGLPGEADLYFENDGRGRFREVAAARGLEDAAGGYGFGVVATDIDADGHVDLFVANDSTPNFLYRNLGNGRFESIGLLAGVAVNAEARAQAGMGAEAADIDGDGQVDLALTTFAHDRNTIYRNLGNVLFEDASVTTGLAASTFTRMGWGIVTLDADLDGRLDLFIANGHIFADVGEFPALGETFAQPNQLLLNDGATLHDVSAAAGLLVSKVSRGAAVGDIDNDGDLDLVISNVDDTPTLLENTQRTGHHWVGVQLRSAVGNRFAIGARVTIEAGGRRQVREVRSGGSYLSQSDLRVFVGLGAHAGPVAVEVQMPGGARWRWPALAADQLHQLDLSAAARVPGGAPR